MIDTVAGNVCASTSKHENVVVNKAENGFVVVYNYNEYGPNTQKSESRTILVQDNNELGPLVLSLFK